jgi:UDPglucose 6-dehydrogenase
MKIGFIGLGKLGMDCAEVMATKYEVSGYDIIQKSSDSVFVVSTIEECVKNKDIVFIAVPTPHSEEYDGSLPSSHLESKDFDYTIVKECIVEANKYMNSNQLLVLISTVLPGTTRKEFVPSITNTRFIYNPYLIALGSVKYDMVNPEMLIIGTDNGFETGDAKMLCDFYNTLMENNPRVVVGTWDECECIKVFYNTFISVKIGLVNMMQDVAMKQGNINVDVVSTALAESTMRIMGPKYMTAGMGDAGGCHPRDNIALRYMAKKLDLGYDLFDAVMLAREIQAKNLAQFLIEQAVKQNMDIIIHGKAYKPDVEYCVGSYSILVGYYIKEQGYSVKFIDPLADDRTDVISTITKPSVILWAHNRKITYDYTGQLDDTKPYCEIPLGSTIVDPWRSLHTDPEIDVIHYGNTR